MLSAGTHTRAGMAFDRLAADYDSLFTFSSIGRSQRDAVWRHVQAVFSPGSHILELNCGTGQDALFMARAGMSVTACDASAGMIEQARKRVAAEAPDARVRFVELPTEEVGRLPGAMRFDGVFSNFSGLNCVQDLKRVAQQIAACLRPGAPLLLCFSTRYCVWEMVYFLLHGRPRKAFRRWGGVSEARIGELRFPVYYPSLARLRGTFAPEFRLVFASGIGITVPPSYLEPWIARHPWLLRKMEALDHAVRGWFILRTCGDHMLLHLEKVR
jgi:ubiquinone/menaquinone biosynthesis C-methylase UbiE